MHAQTFANTPGYIFILIGLILSLASAFLPFYGAGYRFMASILIAGMTPYLVYGLAVPISRSVTTTVTGLVIVIAHAWLVINERINSTSPDDNLIYTGPLIIAIAALPVVMVIIRQTLKSPG